VAAAPLLLFIGRLSPEKRIDRLMPVLAAFPQGWLAIVGDGPARLKMVNSSANNQERPCP